MSKEDHRGKQLNGSRQSSRGIRPKLLFLRK